MTFARFMALALYDAELGYYRQARQRVGYGQGTDFFTASTSGPIFGELIAAAATSLLRDRDPREFTFVELGAEPNSGILTNVAHPFREVRTIRVGEPMILHGRCVVFSNELFDAQPFHRYIFRQGTWRELGVALRDDGFISVELTGDTSLLSGMGVPPRSGEAPERDAGTIFPLTASEGYVIDAPLAAKNLAETIALQPWSGLFIACDYGKSWRELIEEHPAGTARAYRQHTQSNDLLASPGEQDLTCHVCWDWLGEVLEKNGFAAPQIESQEAFLVRHAPEFIARTVAAEADRFSPRKLALMQLLHPAHLGQKFQVLHTRRD